MHLKDLNQDKQLKTNDSSKKKSGHSRNRIECDHEVDKHLARSINANTFSLLENNTKQQFNATVAPDLTMKLYFIHLKASLHGSECQPERHKKNSLPYQRRSIIRMATISPNENKQGIKKTIKSK